MNVKKYNLTVKDSIVLLAAAYAFLGYCHDLIKALFSSPFYDFGHYYIYSKLFIQGNTAWGNNPDLLARINELMGQIGLSRVSIGNFHSPGFLYMISPLTALPYDIARLIWILICQGAFVGSFLLIAKFIKKGEFEIFWGAIFLIFAFWPVREDMFLGQPNALVLLFFTLAALSLKNGRFIAAGIFIGLGVQVKEIFLPILILFILRKNWKLLMAALITFILPKIAHIWQFGINSEAAYWKFIIFDAWNWNAGMYKGLDSLSLLSFFQRIMAGNHMISYALAGAFDVFIIVIVVKNILSRVDKKPELELAYFMVLCFVIGIWVHETHFIVLILPLILVWIDLCRNSQPRLLAVFIAAYLLLGLKYSLSSYRSFESGLPSILGAGKTVGYFLVFFILSRMHSGGNNHGKADG